MLLALLLATNPYPLALPRGCRDRSCVRERALATSSSPPFFQFAPSNGAGMGAVCACSTVTGSNGETITFTRASSGTCMKGNTLSSIANGDLVTCSSNQPRVMYGGNGTGSLGLLKENAITNTTIRSEAFDNAAWLKVGVGAAAPVVTADQAVAPDGNTTADRAQFAATSATQASILDQPNTTAGCNAASVVSESVFVKGVSSSGTIDLCVVTNSGVYSCAACNFVATSWTRCVNDNVSEVLGGDFFFGNATVENGGTTRAAADVYVWGAQCTTAAGGDTRTTSYIATAGATAARALDSASASITWPASSTISIGASVVSPSNVAVNDTAFMLTKDANNSILDAVSSGGKNRVTFKIGGSSTTQDSAASWAALTTNAVSGNYNLVNQNSCIAGVCTGAAQSLSLFSGSVSLLIGQDNSGGGHNPAGVVKSVCLDPLPGTCL